MPGHPCTPEAGAATDPASAPVDGHGHRFRRGVDQPDYVRLLRCFASFDRVALRPSVTRRATLYGFGPQWVSIRPGGRRPPEADRANLTAEPSPKDRIGRHRANRGAARQLAMAIHLDRRPVPQNLACRVLAPARVTKCALAVVLNCVLQPLHGRNGEDESTGRSTGRKDPTFQGVPKTSRMLSGPPATAASGIIQRPPPAFE